VRASRDSTYPVCRSFILNRALQNDMPLQLRAEMAPCWVPSQRVSSRSSAYVLNLQTATGTFITRGFATDPLDASGYRQTAAPALAKTTA
jgi:hypothetical protein